MKDEVFDNYCRIFGIAPIEIRHGKPIYVNSGKNEEYKEHIKATSSYKVYLLANEIRELMRVAVNDVKGLFKGRPKINIDIIDNATEPLRELHKELNKE